MSGDVAFRFRASSESIALLQLLPPAATRKIDAKALVVRYLQQHHKGWVDFAHSEGFDVDSDNLVFVYGTTKTAACVTAAYRGVSQDMEGSVAGTLGPLAGARISVALGSRVQSGGYQRPAPTTIAASDNADSENFDSLTIRKQCIFFNYYKVKRRLFKRVVMQAAAGPHELPPRSPDSGSPVDNDAELEFETEYPEAEPQVSSLQGGMTLVTSNSVM